MSSIFLKPSATSSLDKTLNILLDNFVQAAQPKKIFFDTRATLKDTLGIPSKESFRTIHIDSIQNKNQPTEIALAYPNVAQNNVTQDNGERIRHTIPADTVIISIRPFQYNNGKKAPTFSIELLTPLKAENGASPTAISCSIIFNEHPFSKEALPTSLHTAPFLLRELMDLKDLTPPYPIKNADKLLNFITHTLKEAEKGNLPTAQDFEDIKDTLRQESSLTMENFVEAMAIFQSYGRHP